MDFTDRGFCSRSFQWINLYWPLTPRTRLLLAVSGGLDSMVMLDFFRRFAARKFEVELGVVHVDHGLRPDSQADAEWLSEFCQTKGIAFYCRQVKIKESTQQSSIEAQSREARYCFFKEVYIEGAYDVLLTAHHADDQLETCLMRLIRGSISGLGGIHPVRTLYGMHVFRPLLNQPQSAILNYAKSHRLSWRDDSTNASDLYFRNRVRHHLVPWLRSENPNITSQIGEHTLILQTENDFLEQAALNALNACLFAPGEIDLKAFENVHSALQRRVIKALLIELVGTWKVYTSKHIEAILNLKGSETGKFLVLPQSIKVLKRKNSLLFSLIE